MPVSTPALLPLLSSGHQTKTIDFGSAGVSASLSTSGRLVALFGTHPDHGQILAAPWAQFPADKYHDIQYVREYRALPYVSHDNPEAGFGMVVRSRRLSCPEWSYNLGSWPHSTQEADGVIITSDWIVGGGCVVQRVTVRNASDLSETVELGIDGALSVHRASYSQLTPQGNLSIPPVHNDLYVKDGVLVVHNSHLPASFTCGVYIEGQQVDLEEHQASSEGPVRYSTSFTHEIKPSETKAFTAVYQLGPTTQQVNVDDLLMQATPSTQGLDLKRLAAYLGGGDQGQSLAFIVLRNIDYLLGCCIIPIASNGVDQGSCIITDHQCLPLGWNRDNYWQLDLLDSLYDCLPAVALPDAVPFLRVRLQTCMRAHLQWVFETAQRPHGYWARCFYLWGQPKDSVFQLDQQCYPMLELAEYAERFPDDLDFVRRQAQAVDRALACIHDHRCEATEQGQPWLFKTDETPADDAVEYPFHFSSHILLWRTLDRLAALQNLLGDDTIETPVAAWAAAVHEETLRQFTTTNPATARKMFSYLASSTGDFQFYHDANDLPTALAPAWGFCDADFEPWVNTIAFAFSETNSDGFYPGGAYGGLGSVHTRDPWPLGDGQRLAIMALQSGSTKLRQATLDKIVREVQWDGLFSEAIDRHSGKVTSKHWFSWPGAFISSTLLSQRAHLFE